MTPSDKVAAVLRVELEAWQRRVLDATLVLPDWPESADTARGRVETVLTPEQRARAGWSRWRGLRPSVRDEP